MSAPEIGLERRLQAASDLRVLVRTLKNLAAAGLKPLEAAAHSVDAYARTLELGLLCAVRDLGSVPSGFRPAPGGFSLILAFGSDLGMVGPFNEAMAAFLRSRRAAIGGHVRIWTIGERLRDALARSGDNPERVLALPESLASASALVARVILELEKERESQGVASLHLANHRGGEGGIWETDIRRLLPLDREWMDAALSRAWPTRRLPEAVPDGESLFTALVREHLFASLFRSCVESLACENLSRLAAMERAEKNIDALAAGLTRERNRRVQDEVSQEILEIVTAYQALNIPDAETGGKAF